LFWFRFKYMIPEGPLITNSVIRTVRAFPHLFIWPICENLSQFIRYVYISIDLPMHTPNPLLMGSLVTHCRGGSHWPENPPGPPQDSPKVLAHMRQHLRIVGCIWYIYEHNPRNGDGVNGSIPVVIDSISSWFR